MNSIKRVAFIGNYLPRRCGIATFTHDIHQAVSTARSDIESSVVAMTDAGRSYDYPPAVRFEVHDEKIDDYVQAAKILNNAHIDVVCLQHEYGIFGGRAGSNIIALLSRLDMPVVTTLHTLLDEPTTAQRNVIRQVIDISSKVVAMSEKGREFLHAIHDVPARKIEIIPHGIPDFPFLEPHHAKAKLGFSDKKVILTFGLLSPSKGIETVIDAMPRIIAACPNAVYVILGATHPNLVRAEGEAYRRSLSARAREVGVEDHVVFFNQFVDQSTLLDFISMCDVYATPYLNETQMTSGTLAYSFGLGKAVVSTPYWHAKELLAGGLGVLVPFRDAEAIGVEISSLLTDDLRRDTMRLRAYAESRSMTWEKTAERYLTVFESSRNRPRAAKPLAADTIVSHSKEPGIPGMRIGHFLSLCDDTGMLQHAIHSVPDRDHGYCVDDNARALLLSIALANSDNTPLPEAMTARFAAFIQHAWNPQTRRFRNFMSYDRQWMEAAGSEDSHGRSLWTLGECARKDADPSRRRWAAELFKTALPAVAEFSSPRAWAFTLLGLDAYCMLTDDDLFANDLRKLLAERLMALFAACESADWVWFEEGLAYDNARLCQALVQTGVTTCNLPYVDVGLRSLRWLMSIQTAASGFFRPVGTASFGKVRQKPEAFDQQPLEASATISACLAASRADGGDEWAAGAMRALGWYLGDNDLNTTLIDTVTGSCLDGLHPDRPNQNRGAESVLSYLLGLSQIRQFKRAGATGLPRSSSRSMQTAILSTVPLTAAGDILVSVPILKSPDAISAA